MTTAYMSRGSSPTAQYLDQARQAKGQHFHESAAFSKQPALDELITVWRACKAANWDGYDAFPVREQTFWQAWRFIQALPLGCPLPSVGAEPDGQLTLEWYRHSRWTLSVSVSPDGTLYYAALFGSNDVRGSEFFIEEIPATLLNLIKRVQIK
jgi:hypothetical protein